ncbi:FYVE zinc finger domain protein upa1 [Thecaphora frezii]
MSASDPLGAPSAYGTAAPAAEDPWSGFTPPPNSATKAASPAASPSQQLDDRFSYLNAQTANGGASASMHAPPQAQAGYRNFLAERLPRSSSSFGSNKSSAIDAKPSSRPDSENAQLAWSSPAPSNPPPKTLEQLSVAEIRRNDNPPVPAADSSFTIREAASPPAITQTHSGGPLDDPLSQHQRQVQLGNVQGNGAETPRAQDAPVHRDDDDDDDDEEAFVYPGASASQAAEEEQQQQQANKEPEPVAAVAVPPAEPAAVTKEAELPTAPAASATEPSTVTRAEEAATTMRAATPSPIDYDRLATLCSQGPLSELQRFFKETCAEPPRGSGASSFALANEPNPANGLVPLHFAAKEGRTEIAKWLVNEAGAIVEMEDREGETPLHKAAMSGKLPILTFLLSAGADANAKDADGWTALHNACSRGYLDIVRVLIDSAGADIEAQGGRGGWTPLMNAASKGHLPIVRHLTAKQHADPFIRNASGETAYDVAAATFEIYICEVLEKYEAERWNASKFSAPTGADADSTANRTGRIVPGKGPYNPFALHTTIPVLIHENQRLDTRLKTLAIHGGKPRWSSSSAARPHKPDRRSPSTMPPGPLAPSRTRHTPMRKEDVDPPTRAMPYKLQFRSRNAGAAPVRRARGAHAHQRAAQPSAVAMNGGDDDLASTPTPDSVLAARRNSESEAVERSHFWLSEWQQDLTHPLVSVEEGWQYAQSFDALDDRWSAEIPPPLARVLDGGGLSASVTRAITGGAGAAVAQGDQEVAQGWVRRRRWVRVMRRRLDIEFGDELEASEFAFSQSGASDATAEVGAALGLEGAGSLSTAAIIAAQEAARTECAQLGPDADYLSRAKALAGSSATSGSTPADSLGHDKDELARRIARLVMAMTELRQAFSDEDGERRSRAEDLRKEYTVQLGQLREAAGLDEDEEGLSDIDEDDFIYPNSYKDDGASIFTRLPAAVTDPATPGPSTTATSRPSIPQRHSSAGSLLRGGIAPSDAGTALGAARSADLAASRDFRVPTNEAPNKVLYGRAHVWREQHLQPQWERDDQASECRGCGRRFTFFLRKHHCRRCGKIFCDACSTHRASLSVQELLFDPSLPGMALSESSGPVRICNSCHAERLLPPSLHNMRGADALMPHRPSMSNAANEDEFGRSLAPPSDVSSRASELNECPVCNKTLATLGGQEAQEAHVRACLENGGGGSLQGGRYLVYNLPGNSPIVGKECLICMEEFVANNLIARLPCLCYFHRACIDSWFKRGRECPVHARSW